MRQHPALDLAIYYAIKNNTDLPRMAAVMTDVNDRVLAIGHNQRKTHPLQAKFSRRPGCSFIHAEIDAIVRSIRKINHLKGCSLYVARVKADNTPALAKPCFGCQQAIIAFDISNVYWTE